MRWIHFVNRVFAAARTAANADDVHAQAQCKAREFCANATQAKDAQRLMLEVLRLAVAGQRLPAVAALRVEVMRKSTRKHQQAGDRRLRDRHRGHAGGNADPYALGQQLGEDRMVRAGVEGVHPFDVRRLAHRREERAPVAARNILAEIGGIYGFEFGGRQPCLRIGRQADAIHLDINILPCHDECILGDQGQIG